MQQTENVKTSFAQAVANPTNAPTPPMTEFKGIMLEAMPEQKREDAESERRSKNIIVFNIKESNDDNDTASFVKDLLNHLGCEMSHKGYRLGKRIGGGKHHRPIKVMFATSADKNVVMANLSKLRDAPDTLRQARIVDDLSNDERSLVRAKVAEARRLTEVEADDSFAHMVRGTPTNGLRIERVKKRS